MRLVYSLAWWLALPLVLLRLWWRGRQEPGYRAHWGERLGFYPARSHARPQFPADHGQRIGAASPPPPSSSARSRSPERGKSFLTPLGAPSGTPLIWIHAVSVGETRAAEPLVHALLEAYPEHAILLTHMTPTGRATGAALFGELGPRLAQSYLPYDTGWMMGRFLRHFAPRLCVLMETEVWPNLLAQCRRHQVPVALVNARLSARSLHRAQRFSGLMREAAHSFSAVAAQTVADAERLGLMGATPMAVTGSLKFDVRLPAEALARGATWRRRLGQRPVLLCASTREGEEALILQAFTALRTSAAFAALAQELLLVIVPRHPQRFDEVARLVQASGLRLCRRSDGVLENVEAAAKEGRPDAAGVKKEAAAAGGTPASSPLQEAQVLLGDSMGEMFAYYGACDLAFIGGSLLPLGGQNLIEACAVGKPVLVGPHTFNFEDITEDAIAAGGARRVADAAAMLDTALQLLPEASTMAEMSGNARQFAARHRGATQRTVAILQPLLEREPY